MLLMLFLLLVPVTAQTRFPLVANAEYVLKVPSGHDKWALTRDSSGSEWCWINRENKKDVATLCIDQKTTYTANSMATVERFSASTVLVVLKDGRSGWVARELVDMTPQQWKTFQAQQAVRAKRLTEARAREAEQQAKERAFVAGLPKLRSGTKEVLVATSDDCARDYKAILEFGRRNGTGVEYRKKLLELISLGCAVNLPSGTAIHVVRRDKEFVKFCAYDGPKKGTCGVALREHVD